MGVTQSGEQLDAYVKHYYFRKWRLKVNVNKSVVMTFGKEFVEGNWKWGNRICQGYQNMHMYLEIDFNAVVDGMCWIVVKRSN